MKQIVIKNIELRNTSIYSQISIDDVEDEIIISLSDNVVRYAVTECVDSIVMGLILFAIRNGYDIVSELPITDTLLYNLKYHFIKVFATANGLYETRIIAPTIPKLESSKQIVSTGVSCGVDSLYTICLHSHEDIPNQYKLTHLTFLNAGSHHGAKGVSEDIYEGRRKHVMDFCKCIKMPLIEMTSTLPDFIERHDPMGYSHVNYHTFMTISSMLAIQKGMAFYYYSSGYGYKDFNCHYPATGEFDASLFDLLTLKIASFGTIVFSSFGGDTLRIDKVKYISQFPKEAEYLNVCVSGIENCGKCFKCSRTLLEIDALGQLTVFEKAFDIKAYKKNREKTLQWLYIQHLKRDSFAKELMPVMKDEFTMPFKIKAVVNKIFSIIKNRFL